MKTVSIFLVILCICSLSIYSQLQFGSKQLITNILIGTSVHAADIDGDGDNDVITAGDNS
ncbi:MAG: FG-GAP repeat protein [Bacteroidota bacterium]